MVLELPTFFSLQAGDNATWEKINTRGSAAKSACANLNGCPPHYVDLNVMRELITFSVGQAGNQISTAFWETILEEHGLNKDGVRKSLVCKPY